MSDEYAGLSPAEELRLRDLRRAADEKARNDAINGWLRSEIHRAKGELPPGVGPTPLALEKLPLVPAAVSYLRRTTGRLPTKVGLARRLEVDRDTISDWIAKGWLPWPPV